MPNLKLKNRICILIILTIILNLFKLSTLANPLLNINPDDKIVYDSFYAAQESYKYGTTIKPISMYKSLIFYENYDRIKIYLNAKDDITYYIKPLNSFSASYYYTNSKTNPFIPGRSGLYLEKGSNIFLFQDGFLSLGKRLVCYYQLKETINDKEKKFTAHRAYGKFLFYKFSIEGGIDNINLGPGEYGMILSDNSAPYPLVKLQTEDHLNLLGKWDFLIANGWLNEERENRSTAVITDHNDPMVMAAKLSYKPFDYIECGISRSILYGGKGREKYKILEYPAVLTGRHENHPDINWDNDAYSAYDVSLYLPLNYILSSIKIFKFYFQQGCKEMSAFWQKDNSDENAIHFNNNAYQGGMFLSTENHLLQMEYFQNSKDFYTDENYQNKGYSYRDMSLGYPYGKGIRSFLIKHRYYILNNLSVKWLLCMYYMPDDYNIDINPEKNKMKRISFSINVNYIITDYFHVEPYFSIENAKNTDLTPFTYIYTTSNENSKYITAGISLSLRL